MDKYQKQVEKTLLDHEAETFNELKKTYTTALRDIKIKVKQLQSDVDILEKSNLENKSLLQSKIYQLNYQKAMEEQINSILDVVKNENVRNTQSFLTKMYEDSFLGVNYSLQKKGIPIIMPINNKNIVKVINKPTEGFKFTDRLYAHNKDFKKAVKSEISRGLALGSSYKEIAEQLSLATQVDLNKTYRIVRTEGGRVSSEAKLRSMNEAKKVGADIVKQWDATLDGKTRYQHGKLDQQWTEIDKPFKVDGMEAMAPHGFGRADMDVNCRCVLLSVPRWDLEGSVIKYDNSKGYLVETKNYEDWKDGYYAKIEELGVTKTVIAQAESRIASYKGINLAIGNPITIEDYEAELKRIREERMALDDLSNHNQISIEEYVKRERKLRELETKLRTEKAQLEMGIPVDEPSILKPKITVEETSSSKLISEASAKQILDNQIKGLELRMNKLKKDLPNTARLEWKEDMKREIKELEEKLASLKSGDFSLGDPPETKTGYKEFMSKMFINYDDSIIDDVAWELVEENSIQLAKIIDKYPKIVGYLAEKRPLDIKCISFNGTNNPDTFASFRNSTRTISLNKKYFYDIDEQKYVSRDMESFWLMPAKKENYNSYILTHEFGHFVQSMLANNQGKSDIGSKFAIFADENVNEIYKIARKKTGKSKEELIESYLSTYGKSTSQEAFAEMFANAFCGEPNILGEAMLEYLEGELK